MGRRRARDEPCRIRSASGILRALSPFQSSASLALCRTRRDARLPTPGPSVSRGAVITFDRSEYIRLGGVGVRLFHPGEGCTSGDSIVHLPNSKRSVKLVYAHG